MPTLYLLYFSVYLNIWIFISLISPCFVHYVANESICPIDYAVVWSFAYARTPFLCSPLISDLDGDMMPDIVGTLASGDVIGIHGESGHVLDNWSVHVSEFEFHSTPILFDFNEDGLNDMILFSERGKILFVYSHAKTFIQETIQIPPLIFPRFWFLESDTSKILNDFSKYYLSQNNIILHDSPLSDLGIDLNNSSLVSLPPHIHTTPLLSSIKLESLSKEIIISLSFYLLPSDYFDEKRIQQLRGLTPKDINKYLVEAILVLDPYLRLIVQFKLLSVCMLDSLEPSLLLSTPVIFNFLKSSDRSLIAASISGYLYKITLPQFLFASGFPINLDGSISHTPLIYDIDGDGSLEIFIINDLSDVFCVSSIGQVIWKISLKSKLTNGGGLRMVRLPYDGATLITATQDGMLYAIDPQIGLILPHYPIATGVSLTSLPLIVSLSSSFDPLWIIISNKGEIVLHSHAQLCGKIFPGDRSLISRNPIIYYDLVGVLPGLELLVSSDDGTLTLLSLSIMNKKFHDDIGGGFLQTQKDPFTLYLDKWESPLICQIQNLHRNISLSIIPTNIYDGTIIDEYKNYMAETFTLNYLILDNLLPSSVSERYYVEGRVGEILVFSNFHYKQGSYWVTFPFSSKSFISTLSVFLSNEHGIYDCIQIPVSLNLRFKFILKWLLLIPFIGIIVVLLILHLESGIILPNYIR